MAAPILQCVRHSTGRSCTMEDQDEDAMHVGLGPPPARMRKSSMPSRTASSNSHMYCRTASAVPWNQALLTGLWLAASTCRRAPREPQQHKFPGNPRFPWNHALLTGLWLAASNCRRAPWEVQRPSSYVSCALRTAR